MPLPMPSALVPVIDTQKFDNPLAGLLQAMQAMRTLGGGIRGKAGSGMNASMAKLGLGGELRQDRWGNFWVNDGENAEDKIAKRKAHELEVTRDLVMNKGAEALNLLKNGYVNPETGEAVPWEALDLGRRQQQVENWEATVVPQLSKDLKLDPEQVKEVFTAPVRKENEALAESIAGSSGFMDNLLSGGAGALDSLLTGARGLFSSPEEKIRNAEALQAREQARIAASPFLQNQAKREALGDVARLSGPGSSIAGSLGATLGENAPGLATMMLPGWGVGRLAGMVVPRLGTAAANAARFGVPLAQMGANGVMGGWLADQQLAQDIAATPGLTEAQKAQAYDQGDTMAGLAGFAGGAMMGALPGIRGMFPGATGNVVGRAILGGEAPGVIRSALTTGLEGAMSMGTQQAGVNAARNAGVEQFGVAPRDVMEGVGEAALGGALTGAGLSVATRAGRAMFGKVKSLVTRKSNNQPSETPPAGTKPTGDLIPENLDANDNLIEPDAVGQQPPATPRPEASSESKAGGAPESKNTETSAAPTEEEKTAASVTEQVNNLDPEDLENILNAANETGNAGKQGKVYTSTQLDRYSKFIKNMLDNGMTTPDKIYDILVKGGEFYNDIANVVSQMDLRRRGYTPEQIKIVQDGVAKYEAARQSGTIPGQTDTVAEPNGPATEGAPLQNPGTPVDQPASPGQGATDPAAQPAGSTGPVNGGAPQSGNSGESSSLKSENTGGSQSTQGQGVGSPAAGNGQPTGQPAPGAGAAANQGAGREARQTAGSGSNESTAGNAGGSAENGRGAGVDPIHDLAEQYKKAKTKEAKKAVMDDTLEPLLRKGFTIDEITETLKTSGWKGKGLAHAQNALSRFEQKVRHLQTQKERAEQAHLIRLCTG